MIVGIYGLGRFGSFWARLLSEHCKDKFSIRGYNRTALAHSIPGVTMVDEKTVLQSDALFLCVAISALDTVLTSMAPHIKPGTTVFDTCSVKCRPMEMMMKKLPDYVDIIGTHPMFGPDSGAKSVEGLPFVLSPLRCKPITVYWWKECLQSLGLKVLEMSAAQHDEAAARTQGITHMIGRILDKMDLSDDQIATLGYRSLLEIVEQTCNDPWQLFLDLQHYNPYTEKVRLRLAKAFDEIMSALNEHKIDGNTGSNLDGNTGTGAALDTPQTQDYHTRNN